MYVRFLSYCWLVGLSLAGVHSEGVAQTTSPEQPITIQCRDCEVTAILQDLRRRYHLNMSYSPQLFSTCQRVSVDILNEPLGAVLKRLTACARTKIEWHENLVLFRPLYEYTLSGRISDAESGEWLIGATVRVSDTSGTSIGAITNEYGFFCFRVHEGEYQIRADYVGHRPLIALVKILEDKYLHLRLVPEATLPEIVVRSMTKKGTSSVLDLESGRRFLTQTINSSTTLGGEPDVLRHVALHPGVLAGVDGLGGLHIRGGNADQNLFLLDDVPVYNPAHGLGLMSIFPPSAVNHVQLWKGDFPARYGGRASSVLDVRLRDGNPHRYNSEVSIGLLAASVMLEGPFLKGLFKRGSVDENKNSFLVSIRRTPLELWQLLLGNAYKDSVFWRKNNIKYRFYDVIAKASYQVSPRSYLHLSTYSGGDLFRRNFLQSYSSLNAVLIDSIKLDVNWGNDIVALRWNYVFGNGIFARLGLRYSQFYYESQQYLNSTQFSLNAPKGKSIGYIQRYQTLITDYSGHFDAEFRPYNRVTVRAGLSYAFQTFKPGALSVSFLFPWQSTLLTDSLRKALSNRQRIKGDEITLYGDISWEFSDQGLLEAGFHLGSFLINNRVYRLAQPRLRAAYRISKHSKIWAGVHHAGQFLHQVGTFNLALPFELWVPTMGRMLPEETWQTSAGVALVYPTWLLSIEGYYRHLSRVLTFRSSTSALLIAGAEDASGWENRILTGRGWARGIELMAEKRFKHTTLGAAYTWSRAIRQFAELNNGEPFPFRFDRPHALNISIQQRLMPWLEAQMQWAYATGNPITLTGVKFRHQTQEAEARPLEVLAYSKVNNYRLPNYHRLDLSFRLYFQGISLKHEIRLGAYNLYNRVNPFFLYLDSADTDESSQKVRAVRYALLPILPEFRYTLKF